LRVDDVQKAVAALQADRERVSLFGDRLHVVVEGDADQAIPALTAQLQGAGVGVIAARRAQFSLEDVFIGAVERAQAAA